MKKDEKLNFDLEFLDKKNSIQTGATKKESIKNNSKTVNTVKVRPWVRYWARYLDIVIFSIVFSIFVAIFIPSVLDSSEIFLTILILFVWVFIESILLSNWGTTPGKWILKIQLKDKNGGKPEFAKALNRSFAVWFRGLGFGIPIVTLFTLIVAHNRLTKKGITSWDEEGHFTITHEKIGVVRTIVAVIIFVVFLFFIALGKGY